MSKMLVVNLFGGPGVGKSTTAAGVFAALKNQGFNCELAREYVKEKVWAGDTKVFRNQPYIFGKQLHKLIVLQDDVDIVITDAPLLNSILYSSSEHLNALVLEEFNKFVNLNIFIHRVKEYNPSGRFQTKEEAVGMDEPTKQLLSRLPYPTFYTVTGDEDGIAAATRHVIGAYNEIHFSCIPPLTTSLELSTIISNL